MKKGVIEVPASEVRNLQMVLENKTNLVLVPVYYLNQEKWSLKVEGKISAEITWQQYGYGCAIPNGFGVLKIKRSIPSPTESGRTVEFSERDFLSFGLRSVFQKNSVVLATNYFSGNDVPKEHQTPDEVIKKLTSIEPGDKILLSKEDSGSLTALVLSILRSDNCPEMYTEKIGRIPFDYSSVVFELANVEVL